MTEHQTVISRPIAIIVTADDGGTGKTTFATQIVAFAKLNNIQISLFQLDTKNKLELKTGLEVTSLGIANHRHTTDELIPADIIGAWYSAATAERAANTLLEVGGANAALFHAGITEYDLEEDIQSLDLDVRTFVMCKAGEDSARQTIREVARLESNIPSARIVIVRNEMHGCPKASAQHLESGLRRPFLSLLEKYPNIQMPKVTLRSMSMYERLHVTPDVVIEWRRDGYLEAMKRTSLDRAKAKIFVKDIAVWTIKVFDDLAKVLPEWVDGNE